MTEASPIPGAPSSRSTVKRSAHHASYDRNVIDAILDDARRADELLLHGSVASRLFRTAEARPIMDVEIRRLTRS